MCIYIYLFNGVIRLYKIIYRLVVGWWVDCLTGDGSPVDG